MYTTCTYVCVQVTNDIYNSLTCTGGKLREKILQLGRDIHTFVEQDDTIH